MGWNVAGVLNGMTAYGSSLVKAASAGAARTLLDVYSKAESSGLGGGAEMGYSERTTIFTTTNTTAGSLAGTAIVTGLSVTVIGEGRAVEVEFNSIMQHSVANSGSATYLVVNGSYSAAPGGHLAAVQGGATGSGRTLSMKKRIVLTNGVSYTFTIGVYGVQAGTVSVVSTANIPTFLSVTRR